MGGCHPVAGFQLKPFRVEKGDSLLKPTKPRSLSSLPEAVVADILVHGEGGFLGVWLPAGSTGDPHDVVPTGLHRSAHYFSDTAA